MNDQTRHPSGDDLVLLALGETPDPAVASHLGTCATCSADVTAFRHVVGVARSGPDEPISSPPARVWRGIEVATRTAPAATHSTGTHSTPSGLAAPTPLDSRRKRSLRSWSGLLVAACVGALVGGGAVVAVNALSHTPTVLASAELQPLADGPVTGASGTAEVQATASGDVLAIDAPQLPTPSGYYEVWLLDPTSGGMIAMGVVPPDSATVNLPVPPGVDLSAYAAVDISDEPMDGDPGHSSVSVLRGTLGT
jgi:hypothetical protein